MTGTVRGKERHHGSLWKKKEKKNIEKNENQRRRKTECEEKWAHSYTRARMRPL